MRFDRLAWRVPSPERATEGWVEGRPTDRQIAAAREESVRARAAWRPDDEAWCQLISLQAFVGKHVRLQFWNPIMIMLESEGPSPLTADCRGIVTIDDGGFLQPFLLVAGVRERPTEDGSSPLGYLRAHPDFIHKLAPVADLHEIDEVDEAELDRADRESAPRQNRVTPMGDLVRTKARGKLMGNRGCLHDHQREIVKTYSKSTIDWKSCVLVTEGPKRKLMKPGWYTELFFLDEATALAAGHRPCSQCRPTRFKEFVAAWQRGNPTLFDPAEWKIGVLDAAVHTERLDAENRKVTYRALLDTLPEGTLVLWPPKKDTAPVLVLSDRLLVWTPGGYGNKAVKRPTGVDVTVITPRSIVNALSAGYTVRDLPEPSDYYDESSLDEILADIMPGHPSISRDEWVEGMFLRPYVSLGL